MALLLIAIVVAFYIFSILGYFVGSILFAKIVAKLYGVDIFKVGSGNPGATNVSRTLGSKAGALVFFGDFLKSFVIVYLALKVGSSINSQNIYLALISMLFVILGHNFSIFSKFKGGKGIASAMGGLLVLMPNSFIACALIWVVTFYSTRFVSLASLFFALGLPVATFAFSYPMIEVIFSIFIAAMIFWRHRENIRRLWRGSEYRFVKK